MSKVASEGIVLYQQGEDVDDIDDSELVNLWNESEVIVTADDSTKWRVGFPCRAKFSEDDKFYEATILAIEADGTCEVEFLGYGNTENHVLDDLQSSWGIEARVVQCKHAAEEYSVGDIQKSKKKNTVKATGARGKKRAKMSSPASSSGAAKNSKGPGAAGGSKESGLSEENRDTLGHLSKFPPLTGSLPSPFLMGSKLPLPPPPPPPPLPDIEGDSQALNALLMSWYMAGYHAGLYYGLKQGHKAKQGKAKPK